MDRNVNMRRSGSMPRHPMSQPSGYPQRTREPSCGCQTPTPREPSCNCMEPPKENVSCGCNDRNDKVKDKDTCGCNMSPIASCTDNEERTCGIAKTIITTVQSPVGMGYVPWQSWTETYDLCKALSVGTLFPELDYPFEARRCRS